MNTTVFFVYLFIKQTHTLLFSLYIYCIYLFHIIYIMNTSPKERPHASGAARAGAPAAQASPRSCNLKLMICNTSVQIQIQLSCASSMILYCLIIVQVCMSHSDQVIDFTNYCSLSTLHVLDGMTSYII